MWPGLIRDAEPCGGLNIELWILLSKPKDGLECFIIVARGAEGEMIENEFCAWKVLQQWLEVFNVFRTCEQRDGNIELACCGNHG